MSNEKQSSHWVARTIGAVVVGVAAYLLLSFWNTWDLNREVRAIISLVLGALFLTAGKSLWNWIRTIDYWS